MRSILTALGIIIGVAAVITMVSIGNGAKAMVESQVAALGQNLITVMPGSFSSGGMRSGFGFSPPFFPRTSRPSPTTSRTSMAPAPKCATASRCSPTA